ncbi:hypothetical protein VIGAN_03139400 [Vigna angularis var. angularis]|uniref:Uncharacterized protein n=1 Tax=Vigna angularis var. angularis TaxID=157739 RepID=A0A0S3RLX5_PHAAN|nr:hypothetical protein VIGAN_03139400 [Vigna angularis var. angularis]
MTLVYEWSDCDIIYEWRYIAMTSYGLCFMLFYYVICYDVISGCSSLHVVIVVSTYDDRTCTGVDGLADNTGSK